MLVVGYIDEKKLLLHKILDNTKDQTQAIEADELETLETLIGKRAEIMHQVDKLDQQAVNSAEVPLGAPPEPIRAILAQIITIDKTNQVLMQKGVKDMGKDLVDIKAEIRTIRERRLQEVNYGTEYGSYREEGVFFDTKE